MLFIDSSGRGGTSLNVTANETIPNLIGIVDYHESSLGYTGILLDPTSGYGSASGAATGTAAAAAAAGQITIATQDLDNLYDVATLGSTNYATRLAKTSLAIVNFEHSPDILAVQGAGSMSVLTGLAAQISSKGGPAYTAFWYAGNDSAGLASGFLINTSKVDVVTVEQVGQTGTYTTTSDSTATLFDLQWVRGLCLLASGLLVAAAGHGQVVPAARGGGQTIWLGAEFSNMYAGFPNGSDLRFSSAGIYGVFNWNRHLGLEGESHFLQFNGYHGETEKDLLIGPRYTFFNNVKWRPYATLQLGGARVKYPFGIGQQDFFAIAPSGGVEYRLSYRWSVKAEYQYQILPGSPNFTNEPAYGINPNGVRLGISFRLP